MDLIHYGSSDFSLSRFEPVRNIPLGIKPQGGFWASPVISNHSWKRWCEENEFRLDRLNSSFEFTFIGRAITINSADDLSLLQKYKLQRHPEMGFSLLILDFEKMLRDRVDAVYLTEKGEIATRHSMPSLYSWDCESVLILNPGCITCVSCRTQVGPIESLSV